MNEVNKRARMRSRNRPTQTRGGSGEDAERSMSQQAQQWGASARDAYRSCHDEAEAERLLTARHNRSGQ